MLLCLCKILHSRTASASESSMSVGLLGRLKPRLERIVPFFILSECDVQGSQKIDLKKGEMLTYKNVKENKRCSGSQHKTQNERKISYSYTRTWLHFTSFTHTTIPLLSVLLLNRQTVSWESSLQELVRDIISFLTFTLLCFRVSRHNCQIFSQGLEAASQS